ncbi:MAG: glycosyltransferase [Bacteroidales bacterium]|nr:glycosyltransferase [Bacteroidales bacterium]
MKFSIIVPVYNRPEEIDELLESLLDQKYSNFEVIIVEDGSKIDCKNIVDKYSEKINIKYFAKENGGPASARNYGFEKITGEYCVFFDSDIIVPSDYLQIVYEQLKKEYVDFYGGPDKAHANFNNVQKAINYAMTSFFTTGGIRGGKKNLDKFYPRSFNLGVSAKAFKQVKGFGDMRFGEDIDFSTRLFKTGFKSRLFIDAFVYHKRRTKFSQFFKQVHNSGIARIHLYKMYPKTLKAVHFFPAIFTLGVATILLSGIFFVWFLLLFPLFFLIIFTDSLRLNKSIIVAFLSIWASTVQLVGYGTGFLRAIWNILILKKENFQAFKQNFYK